MAASLFALGRRLGAPMEVVSRSDSTLRGHVIAEMRGASTRAPAPVTGRGFDGVLLIPATSRPAGSPPVTSTGPTCRGRAASRPATTEFAQDATFGYSSSNLRDFVAEKSGGTITADQVHSITLDDIRLGGPQRVAEILAEVTGGAFVVVNATDYADLEIVVLGLLEAQEPGSRSCYRVGPSFPQPLAGLEPSHRLQRRQIWPAGSPGGHGLVVVGSHVGLTSRQVAKAQERGGIAEAELDVPTLDRPRPPGRPRRRHQAAGRGGARRPPTCCCSPAAP